MRFFIFEDGVPALNWLYLPAIFILRPEMQRLLWQTTYDAFVQTYGRRPESEWDQQKLDELADLAFAKYSPLKAEDTRRWLDLFRSMELDPDAEAKMAGAVRDGLTKSLAARARIMDKLEAASKADKSDPKTPLTNGDSGPKMTE